MLKHQLSLTHNNTDHRSTGLSYFWKISAQARYPEANISRAESAAGVLNEQNWLKQQSSEVQAQASLVTDPPKHTSQVDTPLMFARLSVSQIKSWVALSSLVVCRWPIKRTQNTSDLTISALSDVLHYTNQIFSKNSIASTYYLLTTYPNPLIRCYLYVSILHGMMG